MLRLAMLTAVIGQLASVHRDASFTDGESQ